KEHRVDAVVDPRQDDGQVRQRLQLCRRKSARIGSAAQKDQRCELVQEAGGLDGGRDQDEERVQQGQPSIHHLEQLVEDERQGDIGYGDHDMRDETEPVEQFVRLDVLGSSYSIAGHHHDGQPSNTQPEKLEKRGGQGDIGYGYHDKRDENQAVKQFVRLDFLGNSYSIAGHQHDGGNDANGEGAQDDIDQVECAGDSCQL